MKKQTLSCIFGFGGLLIIWGSVCFLPALGTFLALIGHYIECHTVNASPGGIEVRDSAEGLVEKGGA